MCLTEFVPLCCLVVFNESIYVLSFVENPIPHSSLHLYYIYNHVPFTTLIIISFINTSILSHTLTTLFALCFLHYGCTTKQRHKQQRNKTQTRKQITEQGQNTNLDKLPMKPPGQNIIIYNNFTACKNLCKK